MVNPNIEIPPKFPKWTDISSYTKQIVKNALSEFSFKFFGNEPFEVKKSFKDSSGNYGAVTGNFINTPNKEILGGVVLPLNPNITNIPVVGEHVAVTEYNGQHYYIGIINRKNSPNENSIPGVTGPYDPDAKLGETMTRNTDIRHVKVCEGEVLYEGRFGNSIKLGCDHDNNTPNIRIRAGQQLLNKEQVDDSNILVEENINNDASSIYLTTDEIINFDGKNISGTNIFMKSDALHFSARSGIIHMKAKKNIILEGDEVFINAKKAGTIKMGDPKAVFIPTINGQKLFELITSLTKVLLGIPQMAATAGADVRAAADIAKGTNDIVKQLKNKEFLNMQVMTADPNFKIPKEAKVPDFRK